MPETPTVDEAPIEPETEEVPSEPAKGSSPGTTIFVIVFIALMAGAGYYFKTYQPKKELESSDDLDDFEFAEDEDNYIFGDEDLDESVQDKDIPKLDKPENLGGGER